MGSSIRKKKEKQKDFQKAKLKVGKSKAKATNFTDTTFKSKAIVVNQQSLSTDAPDAAELFKRNLSVAATSRSETQRKEALAYLTGQLAATPPNNPVGTLGVLDKVLPLITDRSGGIRTQLLKLLRALPAEQVKYEAEKVVMYIRAGMTHLAAEIGDDALSFLEWLLEIAGDEVVSCPGGWVRTLKSFSAMMNWQAVKATAAGSKGWSSASKSTFGTGNRQSYVKQIRVLTLFLEIGFRPEAQDLWKAGSYWDSLYCVPRGSNPFGYLNLFGAPRDEDAEMYSDRESRQHVFFKRFNETMLKGVSDAKREGGAVGRVGATLDRVLTEGMSDYEHTAGLEEFDMQYS